MNKSSERTSAKDTTSLHSSVLDSAPKFLGLSYNLRKWHIAVQCSSAQQNNDTTNSKENNKVSPDPNATLRYAMQYYATRWHAPSLLLFSMQEKNNSPTSHVHTNLQHKTKSRSMQNHPRQTNI